MVPPVYIEDVDVRSLELLERGFHGKVKAFGAVAAEV